MVRAFFLRMLPLLGKADCFEEAARAKKGTSYVKLTSISRMVSMKKVKKRCGAREKVQ